MRYQYIAVNEAGKKIHGQASGSEKQVLQQLRDRGWTLVTLKQEEVGGVVATLHLAETDLEIVFSRLSYLVNSGVKVDRAMALLARGSLPENIKFFVEDIGLKLNEGQTFYHALDSYRDRIDRIYLASIRLGEETGNLGVVFGYIADSLQERIQLRKEIRKAITYPAVIVAFSLISLFFIFNFIVPRITGIFQDIPEIPWYTTLLINTSQFTINYQFHILAAVILLSVMALSMLRKEYYRSMLVSWLAPIPGIGGFIQQSDQIRFSGAMSLALSSGLPMNDALVIASDTVKNPVSRQSLLNAATEVSEGEGTAEALINAHFYPDFHASLLEVSQDRASLGEAFREIAQRIQGELNTRISRMLVLMEPLLIGVMGIVIGGIVLILMLSILSIQNIGL